MSEKLIRAREYEAEYEAKITEYQKPMLHLTPRTGWMNDPNGFSYFDGQYHMFYQYHPYNTQWGPMHWGHAVSDDMISWKYLPAALAPDEKYDGFGCFSGSAIETKDGKHLILYTGVEPVEKDNERYEIQTQCVATLENGEYVKYANNPVLDMTTLPAGSSERDFRDPKIWMEDDKYYCVVGGKTKDGDGQLLQYSSVDGYHWTFDKIIIKNNGRFGTMWECPDYFSLDNKQVVICSPQDMEAVDLEFYNGNGTLCIVGHKDADGNFVEENYQTIDHGIDFYAPQTIGLSDGRRVMIGWLQNWDTTGYRNDDFPWFGQLSVAREISIVDGKLVQNPVRELANYYCSEVKAENVLVSDACTIPGVQGRTIDFTIELAPVAGKNLYQKFEIRFADDGKHYTTLTIDTADGTMEVDRTHSGSRRTLQHSRKCKVNLDGGKLKLRMVMDRYSAEVFVNDGETAMSTVIFTDYQAEKISFRACGEAMMDITAHELGRSL